MPKVGIRHFVGSQFHKGRILLSKPECAETMAIWLEIKIANGFRTWALNKQSPFQIQVQLAKHLRGYLLFDTSVNNVGSWWLPVILCPWAHRQSKAENGGEDSNSSGFQMHFSLNDLVSSLPFSTPCPNRPFTSSTCYGKKSRKLKCVSILSLWLVVQATRSTIHFRFSEAGNLNARTAQELEAFLSPALDSLGTTALS